MQCKSVGAWVAFLHCVFSNVPPMHCIGYIDFSGTSGCLGGTLHSALYRVALYLGGSASVPVCTVHSAWVAVPDIVHTVQVPGCQCAHCTVPGWQCQGATCTHSCIPTDTRHTHRRRGFTRLTQPAPAVPTETHQAQ